MGSVKKHQLEVTVTVSHGSVTRNSYPRRRVSGTFADSDPNGGWAIDYAFAGWSRLRPSGCKVACVAKHSCFAQLRYLTGFAMPMNVSTNFANAVQHRHRRDQAEIIAPLITY